MYTFKIALNLVKTNRHMGLNGEKTCLLGYVKDTGADSLRIHAVISAFVIRLLKSIISKLATSEISIV